jgi:hypothetical protein
MLTHLKLGTLSFICHLFFSLKPQWPGAAFYISPNKKWTSLTEPGSKNVFYELQPEDKGKIKRSDGTYLEFEPGDKLRLKWQETGIPSLDKNPVLVYIALQRRIAYLDQNGDLVKVQPNYDNYIRACSTADPYPPPWCGFGLCGLSVDQLMADYRSIPAKQTLNFGTPSPKQGPWDGHEDHHVSPPVDLTSPQGEAMLRGSSTTGI